MYSRPSRRSLWPAPLPASPPPSKAPHTEDATGVRVAAAGQCMGRVHVGRAGSRESAPDLHHACGGVRQWAHGRHTRRHITRLLLDALWGFFLRLAHTPPLSEGDGGASQSLTGTVYPYREARGQLCAWTRAALGFRELCQFALSGRAEEPEVIHPRLWDAGQVRGWTDAQTDLTPLARSGLSPHCPHALSRKDPHLAHHAAARWRPVPPPPVRHAIYTRRLRRSHPHTGHAACVLMEQGFMSRDQLDLPHPGGGSFQCGAAVCAV